MDWHEPYSRGDGPKICEAIQKEFSGTIVDSQNEKYLAKVRQIFQTFVKENGADLLMAGGVDSHPSELAHQLIADEIAPVIARILASPD